MPLARACLYLFTLVCALPCERVLAHTCIVLSSCCFNVYRSAHVRSRVPPYTAPLSTSVHTHARASSANFPRRAARQANNLRLPSTFRSGRVLPGAEREQRIPPHAAHAVHKFPRHAQSCTPVRLCSVPTCYASVCPSLRKPACVVGAGSFLRASHYRTPAPACQPLTSLLPALQARVPHRQLRLAQQRMVARHLQPERAKR